MRLLSDDEVLPLVEVLTGESLAGIHQPYLDDARCGPLLRAYLALTDVDPALDLSPAELLANRYYFFARFARAHRAGFGPDAGIDQQMFQILEDADTVDLPWDDIADIDARVADLDCEDA